MSDHYSWRPVTPIPAKGNFGILMREALIARAEQAGLHDPGNLNGLVLEETTDLEWLRGVRDACAAIARHTNVSIFRADAIDLIDAITAQGPVQIEVAYDKSDEPQEPFTDEPF